MDSVTNLRTAIERAYEAFAPVPYPRILECSPDRDGAAILRSLTSAPLREVPGEAIGPYAGWAMTTVGSASDYRHFLPRILELTVKEPSWMGTEPAVIASRMKMACWTTWPRDEQVTVRQLFDAAFLWALDWHEAASAEDWLCGLAVLGEPLEGQLAEWRRREDVSAIIQLIEFVRASVKDVSPDGEISGCYWDEGMPAATRKLVGQWLKSPETRAQIKSSVNRLPTDDAWKIEAALALLPQY